MSTENTSKINQILRMLPKGAIATDTWLRKQGISNDLKRRYIKSGWFERIGYGACKRYGETTTWPGAVWGLVRQGIEVHVGGKTALSLHGFAHFIRHSESIILLKSASGNLPKWFFGSVPNHFQITSSRFLPIMNAITDFFVEGLEIPVSLPEQAIIEQVYFINKSETFEEASHLMEGLTGLRPNILQVLLEKCQSVRVKRVVLFLAEYHKHPWFKKIDPNKIDLGSGKRQVVPQGSLDNKYQITIPKGFASEHGKNIF